MWAYNETNVNKRSRGQCWCT